MSDNKNIGKLRLVNTNDPTGKNITQLTFSCDNANDSNKFEIGRIVQFNNGTVGFNNNFVPGSPHMIVTSYGPTYAVQVLILNSESKIVDNLYHVSVDIYPTLFSNGDSEHANLAHEPNITDKLYPGMRVTIQSPEEINPMLELYLEIRERLNNPIPTNEGDIGFFGGMEIPKNRNYILSEIAKATKEYKRCSDIFFELERKFVELENEKISNCYSSPDCYCTCGQEEESTYEFCRRESGLDIAENNLKQLQNKFFR